MRIYQDRNLKGKQLQVMEAAKTLLTKRSRSFKSDAEIFEAAATMFSLREFIYEEEDAGVNRELAKLAQSLRQRLHRNLGRSAKTHMGKTFKAKKLNEVESEILLLLSLGALGMRKSVHDIEDLQAALKLDEADSINVVKALCPEGRLACSELVILDHEETPMETRVRVSREFLGPLISNDRDLHGGWDVSSYQALLDRTYTIVQSLQQRAEKIRDKQRRDTIDQSEIAEISYRMRRHIRTLHQTLDEHPKWPLRVIFDLGKREEQIVLALLGKELGFYLSHDDLFTGEGLARAVSRDVPQVRHQLALLKKEGDLRKKNYIRVCGGKSSSAAVEDETTLRSCEFELTNDFLKKIRVKRQRRSSQQARQPMVRLDQLVLSQKVMAGIRMALVQVRKGNIMIDRWGLDKVIPYGRAVTMLFHGAPGLGKTASAEAIAHELGKTIIAISYAEIQNCWVGETEKNIVKVFREAGENDAVLFWDECDAMFFDRDGADRNWEVRDVNVLLQELERFEGLCILSTNRKITLDQALERRIAIKIEFERPDQAMRKRIWQKLLPRKMPLDKRVSLEELSRFNLTGAEIKNVILNTARIVLMRNNRQKADMRDFKEAIRMEEENRWNREESGRIGFRRNTG